MYRSRLLQQALTGSSCGAQNRKLVSLQTRRCIRVSTAANLQAADGFLPIHQRRHCATTSSSTSAGAAAVEQDFLNAEDDDIDILFWKSRIKENRKKRQRGTATAASTTSTAVAGTLDDAMKIMTQQFESVAKGSKTTAMDFVSNRYVRMTKESLRDLGKSVLKQNPRLHVELHEAGATDQLTALLGSVSYRVAMDLIIPELTNPGGFSVRKALQEEAKQKKAQEAVSRDGGITGSTPENVVEYVETVDNAHEVIDFSKVSPAQFEAVMLSCVTSSNAEHRENTFHLWFKAKKEGKLTPNMWEHVFWACTSLNAPDAMVDRWLKELDTHLFELAKSGDKQKYLHEGVSDHAWDVVADVCYQLGDIERAMRVWGMARKHYGQVAVCNGQSAKTAKVPLSFTCRMTAVGRKNRHDGGYGRLMLDTIRKDYTPEDIMALDAFSIEQLIQSVPPKNGMVLLKRWEAHQKKKDVEAGLVKGEQPGKKNKMTREGHMKLYLWLQLLRSLCHRRHIAEAESVFKFLSAQLTRRDEAQKEKMVLNMMLMYGRNMVGGGSSTGKDFDSCNGIFQNHVLVTPAGQPKLQVTAKHYQILIQAAGTSFTKQQLFMEACAAGVKLHPDVYAGIFASTGRSVEAISHKLPQQYTTSEFDRLLRVPADVDAHAAREDAQRMRGKKVVDSTMPIGGGGL